MSYTNFTEYWKAKGDMLTRLGVTKDVAHQIWNDAIDLVQDLVIKYS